MCRTFERRGHVSEALDDSPPNPYCPACKRAKLPKAQSRRKLDDGPGAATFGEIVTADHLIARDDQSRGIDNEGVALVLLDRAMKWVDVFPAARKSAADTEQAFRQFGNGDGSVDNLYWDAAPELVSAALNIGIRHSTSTPCQSPANGLAERKIRLIFDGARTALEQSGLGPAWRPSASRHSCRALNIAPPGLFDPSPWQLRHGVGEFPGKRIPFGALVDARPPSPVLKQMPRFAPRSVPALFL